MDRFGSGSPYEPLIGYCRVVLDDSHAHVAGTTGLDPDRPGPQAITEQCALALDRLAAALAQCGLDFSDLVRVRYYLTDPAEFEPCWPLLRAAFGAAPPAATMVVVAGLIDPRMKIEIEATACRRSIP